MKTRSIFSCIVVVVCCSLNILQLSAQNTQKSADTSQDQKQIQVYLKNGIAVEYRIDFIRDISLRLYRGSQIVKAKKYKMTCTVSNPTDSRQDINTFLVGLSYYPYGCDFGSYYSEVILTGENEKISEEETNNFIDSQDPKKIKILIDSVFFAWNKVLDSDGYFRAKSSFTSSVFVYTKQNEQVPPPTVYTGERAVRKGKTKQNK